MEEKRLEYLLNTYLTKTSSPVEENELFGMLDGDEYDEYVLQYMDSVWGKTSPDQFIGEAQSEKILNAILGHSETKVIPLKAYKYKKGIRRIAAAVIILIAGASFLYLLKNSNNKTAGKGDIVSSSEQHDVSPGRNGAVLTLANGASVLLDSTGDGNLAQQGNMLVMKNGGRIDYLKKKGTEITETVYNKIETPRGHQFQLTLTDGTRVWLNAASSIRFPVAFIGNERKVEITGEVYFEVAKDKSKPFIVEANNSSIEVLGTHFNVNAYNDESSVNTTLLEGLVKVVKGNAVSMLSPGQQAQVSQNGDIRKVNAVNVSEVVAWKDNLFYFNNTDIKKLMRQLERWYDVDVVFKGDIPTSLTFNGTISRGVNLSAVLKMLEYAGEIKFSIEGKQIIAEL
jgi:transmembrane sensor